MVERKHRTTMEMGLTMVLGRNLPKTFWGEVVHMAIRVFNRTKTKAVAGKTPYESCYGKKPTISHFRISGSKAFVHVHKDVGTKLDSKSKKLSSLGVVKNPRPTTSRLGEEAYTYQQGCHL